MALKFNFLERRTMKLSMRVSEHVRFGKVKVPLIISQGDLGVRVATIDCPRVLWDNLLYPLIVEGCKALGLKYVLYDKRN